MPELGETINQQLTKSDLEDDGNILVQNGNTESNPYTKVLYIKVKNVNSDWNSVSGYEQILNKPIIVNTIEGRSGNVILTKNDVDLSNVDNTSDLNKPVSIATQTLLDLKPDKSNILELDNTTSFTPDGDYEPSTKLYTDTVVSTHEALINNPHSVTKDQVGLSNVDNTADIWQRNGTTLEPVTTNDSINIGIGNLSIGDIQLNTTISTPTYAEGKSWWDNTNKTISWYDDITGTSIQAGQELIMRAKNDSGSIINNGGIVYLSGHDGTNKLVKKAKSDNALTCIGTIAIATHDVGIGNIGKFTRLGTINDLNTLGCNAGDILYLSSTNEGKYTVIRPESPNYDIIVGKCSRVHGTLGSIEVGINIGQNTRSVLKIFNGAILESHTFNVTSDGVDITATLEKTGGGDLSLFFDGEFSFFDCTPIATVTLIPGTDQNVVHNYIYIPKSTNILTTNNTGFPTNEQFIPVGTVLCQSPLSAQTKGLRKVHAWTDHLSSSLGEGHLSHINYWIRNQESTWIDGISPTLIPSIGEGSSSSISYATSSGQILQLHKHSFPAKNTLTGDIIYVINHPTTPNLEMSGLVRSLLTVDSLGNSFDDRRYNVVIWGVVSESDFDCQYYLNLPSGSYGSNTAAIEDVGKTSNYTMPSEYKGTGFLISQITLRDRTSGGGTLEVINIRDLRGSTSLSANGGTGVQTSNFTDSEFSIYNNLDNTKILNYDVSNITTGTTKTLSVLDKDYTIGNVVGPPTSILNSIAIYEDLTGENIVDTNNTIDPLTNQLIVNSGEVGNAGIIVNVQSSSGEGLNVVNNNTNSVINLNTLSNGDGYLKVLRDNGNDIISTDINGGFGVYQSDGNLAINFNSSTNIQTNYVRSVFDGNAGYNEISDMEQIDTAFTSKKYNDDQNNIIKDYVDNLIEGLKWKQSVLISSVGNNLTLSGEQTIDGILTNSSRLLVKDQTDKTENGIYITNVNTWTRSNDADTGINLVSCVVNIEQGIVNKDTMFVCTNDAITIGITEIVFVNLGSTISHNNTTNLQGGAVGEYNHLTNAEKTLITTNQTNIGTKVTKVTSTDNAIPRFNGTTGELQDSGVIINDDNRVLVNNNVNSSLEVQIKNLNSGINSYASTIVTSDSATVGMYCHSTGRTNSRYGQTVADSVEFLAQNANKILFGSTSNIPIYIATGSTVRLKISSTGAITMIGVYNNTTASSANVNVDSSGNLKRSTSSLKYKDNINYEGVDGSMVYDLKPVSFQDKNTHTEYIGFVAEDVHLIEPRLVDYNDENEPDALHYGQFTALNTKAIQDLKTIIDKQQNVIEQIQIRLDALEIQNN